MNKRQRERAMRLIKKDCQITHRYLHQCADGGVLTCAVGCLALAAGVSQKELLTAGREVIDIRWDIAGRIEDAFGIDMDNLCRIQRANDKRRTVNGRRNAVLRIIKSL